MPLASMLQRPFVNDFLTLISANLTGGLPSCSSPRRRQMLGLNIIRGSDIGWPRPGRARPMLQTLGRLAVVAIVLFCIITPLRRTGQRPSKAVDQFYRCATAAGLGDQR